jgi:hypothetical protein
MKLYLHLLTISVQINYHKNSLIPQLKPPEKKIKHIQTSSSIITIQTQKLTILYKKTLSCYLTGKTVSIIILPIS